MCNVKHNAITFFFSKWEISLHKINFQVFRDLFFSSSELIFLCGNLNILSFKFLYHRNIIFKKKRKKKRKKFYRFLLSFQNCSMYLYIIIHYALHNFF